MSEKRPADSRFYILGVLEMIVRMIWMVQSVSRWATKIWELGLLLLYPPNLSEVDKEGIIEAKRDEENTCLQLHRHEPKLSMRWTSFPWMKLTFQIGRSFHGWEPKQNNNFCVSMEATHFMYYTGQNGVYFVSTDSPFWFWDEDIRLFTGKISMPETWFKIIREDWVQTVRWSNLHSYI